MSIVYRENRSYFFARCSGAVATPLLRLRSSSPCISTWLSQNGETDYIGPQKLPATIGSIGAFDIAEGFALRPVAIMIAAARYVCLSRIVNAPSHGAGEAILAAESIRCRPAAIMRIRHAPVERGAALTRRGVDIVIDRDHIRRRHWQRRSRHHGLACRGRCKSDPKAQYCSHENLLHVP